MRKGLILILVMGIDSSTTSTGWCILDNEENKIYARGVIKPDKRLSMLKRIIYIEKEIKAIYAEYEPEYICIEEMVAFRNANSMRALIGLLYHLVIEFEKREALVVLVRPSEWRKGKVKGRVRSEYKANCIEYVKNKYGIEVEEDVADAICIAEYDCEVEYGK